MWNNSYDGNSYCITSAHNGQGLQQTFIWQNSPDNLYVFTTLSEPLSCTANRNRFLSEIADDVGVGRQTGETFASGPNQSVTGNYHMNYNAQGQMTGRTMTLGGQSYPFTAAYNDAGSPTSVTYPGGDVVAASYTAQGQVGSVTLTSGGTTTALVNSIQYTGIGGQPVQASVGNGTYQWNLGYDGLGRTTSSQAALTGGATLFRQNRTYDAVGNVLTAQATLPAGTDNQAYCYDEQNRLTWAGSTGTAPCQTLTPGTLTAANYTQSYAYDTMNRLTSGPLGAGYGYGDAAHLDAVTTAPNYAASYDAAGEMTSRNGQPMTYDAMRRMLTWQNTASTPTSTASYAYDGEGERVQQTVTTNGTTTTTQYIGTYEEISTTGSTTTTTKYYDAGVAKVTNVNGTLSYLVSDGLGSVSASLDASGNLTSAQLFAPYGASRYSSGTMPTSYGFTGQRGDPSGLTYMHARYYDGSVGQFTSADTVQGPNRYGYVAGNPTTMTDPTGQMGCLHQQDGACLSRSAWLAENPASVTPPKKPTQSGSSTSGGSGSGCHSDANCGGCYTGCGGGNGQKNSSGGEYSNDPFFNIIVSFLQSKGYGLDDIFTSLKLLEDIIAKHTGLVLCGGFLGLDCGGNIVQFCIAHCVNILQVWHGEEFTKDQLGNETTVLMELAGILGVGTLATVKLPWIIPLIVGVLAAKMALWAGFFSYQYNHFTASKYVIVVPGYTLGPFDPWFFNDKETFCYPDAGQNCLGE